MVRLSVSTRWTITFSSRKSPSSVPWTACRSWRRVMASIWSGSSFSGFLRDASTMVWHSAP